MQTKAEIRCIIVDKMYEIKTNCVHTSLTVVTFVYSFNHKIKRINIYIFFFFVYFVVPYFPRAQRPWAPLILRNTRESFYTPPGLLPFNTRFEEFYVSVITITTYRHNAAILKALFFLFFFFHFRGAHRSNIL